MKNKIDAKKIVDTLIYLYEKQYQVKIKKEE